MTLPLPPPSFWQLTEKMLASPERLGQLLQLTGMEELTGHYYHWDKLRHLPPPLGLSSEEWWYLSKLSRRTQIYSLPFQDKEKNKFVFSNGALLQEKISEIETLVRGQRKTQNNLFDLAIRESSLHESIINESIFSSLIEGAATTREIARDMIYRRRHPRDIGERMVKNNYDAMEFLLDNKGSKLTPEMIFSLHKIITDQTLKSQEKAGAFRRKDDNIVVMDEATGRVIHSPPPAGELPERLEKLCLFANSNRNSAGLHPLIIGITLHFMIGYDHPFVDGNGRVARALFYWYQISHAMEIMKYISISNVIKSAPIQYLRAFANSETDEGDITYFLLHQLSTVKNALEIVENEVISRRDEYTQVEKTLSKSLASIGLNSRQISLLRHALKNPGRIYDVREHQSYHGVSYNSARTDLLSLSDEMGLLDKTKRGKTYYFRSPGNLQDRMEGKA